jgi:hypothetical protein
VQTADLTSMKSGATQRLDLGSRLLLAALERQGLEATMLHWLGESLGVRLTPKSLPLPGGGVLEIDGFSASPGVLCQVHAQTGPMSPEQEDSAVMDAFKLAYAACALGNTSRRILLFRDPVTARGFQRKLSVAGDLEESIVEVRVAAC